MNRYKRDGALYTAGLKNYYLPSLLAIFHPKTITFAATSLALVVFASSARGEIFLFMVMLWKNWGDFRFSPTSTRLEDSLQNNDSIPVNLKEESEIPFSDNDSEDAYNSLDELLRPYHMQQFYIHVLSGLSVSYLFFFGIGGFLQWRYYIQRRDRPEEWKCQPNRFLTAENERHEILLGAGCLLVAGSVSGLAATYVINGGKLSRVYFDINDYGWPYFFVSSVLLFLMQDGGSYYYHRMLHLPFFYRNFHKWHHRYHSPTAFSAVAMHPIESTIFQIILLAPLFLIPLHFVSVVGSFYYMYYFGLVDHSGIDLESIWPWQPPVRFHDDHHKYFHVNFGFNTMIFDRFHDTLRRKDRKYGEDIFYGKGKSLKRKSE